LKRRAAGELKKVAKRRSRAECVEVEPDNRREPVEPKMLGEAARRSKYACRTAGEVVSER